MSTSEKCEHQMIDVRHRVHGFWEELVHRTGEIEWTNTDKMIHAPQPKTGTCSDCGKRVPNPLYIKP